MTSQPLDLTIFRGSRKQAALQVTADPANPAELQAVLVQWLAGSKWGESLWPQFELVARAAGGYRVLSRVRTP